MAAVEAIQKRLHRFTVRADIHRFFSFFILFVCIEFYIILAVGYASYV